MPIIITGDFNNSEPPIDFLLSNNKEKNNTY